MTVDAVRYMLFLSSVINIALLVFMFLSFYFLKNQIREIYGNFFTITPGEFNSSVYKMLGFYKILILFFNVVPYIAISIVAFSDIMQ
jgi:hypothetical protein